MSLGLVGRKVGMTRVFQEDGASIPVTVLDMSANRITQIKTPEVDGYSAIQVTFGSRRASRVIKPAAGHFAKAGVEAGLGLHEFRVDASVASAYKAGDTLDVALFTVGQVIDVTGTSKGKGFSGAIKRHNFSSNRATHGNSVTTRAPGSIGMAQDPGRVFPGKRMAGRYGGTQITTQCLEVVRVDVERQLLLVKGAVPGAISGQVTVLPSVKARV
jgi:large subunit ribosomal protein L3